MAPAPAKAPAFEVELCELVVVGGGDALLRVAGSWSPEAPEHVDLVTFGAGALERTEPLPPGATIAADCLWHVAFCVAETTTSAHLALMTPAGVPVALPAPARLLPAPIVPSPQEQELASERSARADVETRLEHALEDLSDAQALVDQLRHRCALSERGLAEFRDKLVTAWGESASMRDLLDRREAAHEAAKQRARAADDAVAEVEARSRRSQRELAERRDELQQQCALLQDELKQRVASELSTVEQLAETETLRADAADALRRFEAARADAESLEAELDRVRASADQAAEATARAAREILDERMKAESAAHDADVFSERLAKAERELREARDELAAARDGHADAAELVAALEAETGRADAATERVAEAERELASARQELAAITAHVETLEANIASAVEKTTEELVAERARAEEAANRASAAEQALEAALQQLAAEQAGGEAATARIEEAEHELIAARRDITAEKTRADAATERVAEAERELASAREDLVAIASHVEALEANTATAVEGTAEELAEERTRAEAATGRAAAAEQALEAARQEVEAVRKDVEAEKARADEAARRAGEAEWQLNEAREQVVRTQQAAATEPTPAQAAVEEDLRHLLERRERELEDARAELAEQRARYTAVASEVPPVEEPPAAEPVADAKAEPWSRVDEDLLERLARAKSLAGGD